MLTEQTLYDKIELLEDGQIQLRQATRVFRDGVQIAYSYHREVLDPAIGFDRRKYSDQRIAQLADLMWTPAVVQARRAVMEAASKLASSQRT